MVRRVLYVEEGADRSGGHCIKRRVRTGEEGDVRSERRRQVRRALYGEKGVDWSEGAERE